MGSIPLKMLSTKMYYTEHVPKELGATSFAKQIRNNCALVGLFLTILGPK